MKTSLLSLFVVFIFAFLFISVPQTYAVPPTNFQTRQVVTSGLEGPSGLGISPDGRIFILQRTGEVQLYKNGQLLTEPFTTLPSIAAGDRGLIGITFDPDYVTNHYVYFWYTGLDLKNRLVRFNASTDIGSEGPVILYETPGQSQQLHVGGGLAFGPDGKMYVGVGDNGYPPNAQDLSNPYGKVLRINKTGSIPLDNPFIGQSGVLPEIWAYGFRNPWRLQFDSVSGYLYGGDVGEATWEEVNRIVRGGNYGQPFVEGKCNATCPYIDPIYTYNHDNLSSAVTGGPVYRGSNFPSEFNGSYFFGDYARGFIKRLTLDGNGNATGVFDFDTNSGSVVDLKTATDGTMYYVTYYPPVLYQIVYSTGNHIPVANASSNVTKGTEPLTVNFSSSGSYDPDNNPITYLWRFGDGTTSAAANPTKTYTQKR